MDEEVKIRIYEDGFLAYQDHGRILKAINPYTQNLVDWRYNEAEVSFLHFLASAYDCLPFINLDMRFNPPKLYRVVTQEKALYDYQLLFGRSLIKDGENDE